MTTSSQSFYHDSFGTFRKDKVPIDSSHMICGAAFMWSKVYFALPTKGTSNKLSKCSFNDIVRCS